MPLYINYPSFIHPEVFPGVPFLSLIRWYGLMYIFAFLTAWFVLKRLLKENFFNSKSLKSEKITEDDVLSFLFTGIVFLLIGARLGSALIYESSGIFRQKPWLIFWPFDESGKFTGLAGMSYHGGFIGGLIGMIVWCCIKKKRIFQWIDAMVIAIPCGYTFGRLGNFLNGELYGRITKMPWGMVFPYAEKFPANEKWVQDFCSDISMNIEGLTFVNLPRHPSQLYEAFFEGIVLFLVLWFLRKHKKWDGLLSSIYMGGYGLVRFFIEYFRQPDAELGFRNSSDSQIYLNNSIFNLSTGQILCLLMIIGSAGLAVGTFFYYKRKDLALDAKSVPNRKKS